ncbi:hypothetical protein GLOTRDRAFT_138593 [Gloeophyllum trabeum ATCC 11539]|uniref:PLD phosphodiesterase domain-containing protein n=1 Tax=Gloeophyllum trabeum (strain ATCC 11539 / FP-39264 / Madison 617) TaxID=670483 RepID=S7Q8S0_GLOTA|nr:uncharacterized protein GLOTRDRAFT_138593 [Gloeophyllum trabeum ATCC 11539]EPQ55823.1 hypothetical protein GLOTRDRAFT_138593 [Gloeophyllum trabeum ATCC 11539]
MSTNKEKDRKPHELVRTGPTVTQALAENPHLSPRRAAWKTYPKPFFLKRLLLRFQIRHDLYKGRGDNDLTQEDLDEAAQSGNFPYRPSNLFLKIYSDVLLCLARDPLSGLVSPPLMASSAVMPLSIISVIPDIMKHYYHCIVNAEKQVLLATNYLQPSDSHKTIFNAFRELSKRVGERGQKEKIIVKLIYDRGTPKQFFKNHVQVKPNSGPWKGVELPDPSEIPNIDLEVINFHRVLLGTFHAKFMVVDEKVVLLNSNNIQDRPNVEMMIHLEGPIVSAFVDTFVLSWNNRFKPLPPLIAHPVPPPSSNFKFDGENPFLRHIDVIRAARAARALLKQQGEGDRARAKDVRRHHGEWQGALRGMGFDFGGLEAPGEASGSQVGRQRFADAVETMMQRHGIGGRRKSSKNVLENGAEDGDAGIAHNGSPSNGESKGVQLAHAIVEAKIKQDSASNHDTDGEAHEKNGTAAPDARSAGSSTAVDQDIGGHPKDKEDRDRPINGASAGQEADANGQLERPAPEPLSQSASEDSRTSTSRAVPPVDGNGQELFDSPEAVRKRKHALSQALNAGTIRPTTANIDDDTLLEDFRPHLIHKAHDPFPIALVNRKPHGMPGHQDIRTPQNAAWLAGFRYAKRKVFIQTPTLNAAPVVRACIDTAKRGVQVVLYLDLGFNDKGESIPFQGGTNQEVVIKMYKELKKVGKEQFLDVYWYTGKDQIRPINAIYKSRNCHVKFMVIDDEVGIQGNGNQDTQSWFHSEEVNVLVDSKQIVREWMEALEANQNTGRYGKVQRDGIWRDSLGRTVSFYDDEVTEQEKERKRKEKEQAKKHAQRVMEKRNISEHKPEGQ